MALKIVPSGVCLWHMVTISFLLHIYTCIWLIFCSVTKYHQMSPKGFMCHKMSSHHSSFISNLDTHPDVTKCHEVKSPKCFQKKNMVTFNDLSWLILTLSDQLAEVTNYPKTYQSWDEKQRINLEWPNYHI